MKAVRPVASRLGPRSSTARRSKPLDKRNATAQAVEGNLGGFCVWICARENGPGADGRAEAARVRTADRGVGKRAHAGPVEVLALTYELGLLAEIIFSWPSAAAYQPARAQAAYYARLPLASRAAPPSSWPARGSISIGWYIGPSTVCGDAGGGIKLLWPSCPRVDANQAAARAVIFPR
jgi:hypothetical protein